MHLQRYPLLVSLCTMTLLLSACVPSDTSGTSPSASDSSGSDHGEVTGATQVAEPPLQLLSIDDSGNVGLRDLLDDSTTELGTIPAPQSTATDGRYVFANTPDGLHILDSGTWTWDHVDHFHYYRSAPSIIGAITGEGPATVATGPLSTAGTTGVFFSGSREAVLLDNSALAEGTIVELFRISSDLDAGLVVPLGDGALVAEAADGVSASAENTVAKLRYYSTDGKQTDFSAPCRAAAGTITTRVGAVIGCADGAILATLDGDSPVFERIPYPANARADPAVAFDGRKGRPTVAALAGTSGFWLLDTRERTWRLVETEHPLVRVSAVDDSDGHVVAVDHEGRVSVFLAESGEEVATTQPLVAAALSDPVALAGLTLVVDAQRAYVNAASEGVVYEIAFADDARIARTLSTPTAPSYFAEVGR